MLKKICSVDRELWKPLMKRFEGQINSAGVSKRELKVREILHRQPLLSVKLHDQPMTDEKLIQIISLTLVDLANQHSELAKDIVSLACRWQRFSSEAAAEIKSRALHRLRLS